MIPGLIVAGVGVGMIAAGIGGACINFCIGMLTGG